MLVRLLVVLTLLGQPAPRACTCAADTTVPTTSATTPTPASASCRCSHRHAGKDAQHARPGVTNSKCDSATSDHPPTQHAPNCPACHPVPVDAVAQSLIAVIDTNDLAGSSAAFPPPPHPAPTREVRAGGAAVPHVPLFIALRVLRN
jgi:hypothetical protein